MKVYLVQNEIEEALRNHVLGMFGGMGNSQRNIDMQFEFSSTRGDKGVTVEIDLYPQKAHTGIFRENMTNESYEREQPVNEAPEAENDGVSITPEMGAERKSLFANF